jgi:hypothetical protein
MVGKFFKARDKLKDIDSLKKFLQQNELSRDEYHGLLRVIYDNHRAKFTKMAELLREY